jgi:hypothetical protein
MPLFRKILPRLKKLKIVGLSLFALLCCLSSTSATSQEAPLKIETMLVDNWRFFAQGDSDRNGYWSEIEFMAHPGYKDSGFDLSLKTFIFWMVDDDKDSRISLQEWFNNELGQFQLGDSNHDGIMTAVEHEALEKIENKLFADLKPR